MIMSSAVSTPTKRGRRWVPPPPGKQAQTGFRQAQPGGTVGDAVVTAQRDFQPAAQH